MKKLTKSEIWGFELYQKVETTKTYCISNPEEYYHSGKIRAMYDEKSSNGSKITFISEQKNEAVFFFESELQPYIGLKFQGKDTLTDTTLEETLKNIKQGKKEE